MRPVADCHKYGRVWRDPHDAGRRVLRRVASEANAVRRVLALRKAGATLREIAAMMEDDDGEA